MRKVKVMPRNYDVLFPVLNSVSTVRVQVGLVVDYSLQGDSNQRGLKWRDYGDRKPYCVLGEGSKKL